MAQFRRRSWESARQPGKEGLRLSSMIVLLAIVLLMMFAASRPAIWEQLFPNLDTPTPTNMTEPVAGGGPATPKTEPAPPRVDHQSTLRLAGLILLAVVYFAWRFARMGRAVITRSQSKPVEIPKALPNSESAPPNAEDAS
jgi:flagellar biogenesis protein FliO